MFIFILDKFYDQNIFKISSFLKQKCKKRNISFATKTDPNKPDRIRLYTAMISWTYINSLTEILQHRLVWHIIRCLWNLWTDRKLFLI
jgi:hypothetical protein